VTLNETYALPGIAVITGIIAAVLGATKRYAYMLLVLATGLSQLTNAGLKALADSPRPRAGLVEVSERAAGLGYPSGHTMSVVVLSGIVIYVASQMIAQRRLRWAVQAMAAMQVLGIAFSRIYTGAHWPSDVLGGLLWGAWFTVGLLAAYHWLAPRCGARLNRASA
jgi:membrane-associated phospholipid phosphatase